ncbi:DUF7716 domain-containing protein [Citrobacter sp. FP75]|uniref:DUF7716 domain-containing protein n=1 Tax=Citrobacter sp. FP75 TaxID=1852949 RepID=UPI001BCA1D19|nr:hypothetical protein [Citrobacter sp. FP75]
MKMIEGFEGLLRIYKELDVPWCFFVDTSFRNNIDFIRTSSYYIAESDDEFDEMDDTPNKYKPWLEYQVFQAIIDNKLEHYPDASNEDLLDAVIYYLEEDDFLD